MHVQLVVSMSDFMEITLYGFEVLLEVNIVISLLGCDIMQFIT
jgi:hypothetical protein